ncbi:MAG: DUF362 domain-containing protein [Candidatus Thorarchaeota archaeon]|jgi:uncharacterized protein (DUF362 family)
MTKIYLASGTNRTVAVQSLLGKLNLSVLSGKRVAVKANFNSADPFPASTHPDTFALMIDAINDVGAEEIHVGARSGMGNTQKVLDDLGITTMCQEKEVKLSVLDDFTMNDYTLITLKDSHWSRGFLYANLFENADVIIQTCCLKTHQYGGHFTLSLKNSVGMVAKFDPNDNYNYMKELHSSPHQRHMIAELNTIYDPAFVLMDAAKAFVKGGPASGEEVTPNVFLLSPDRVALDTVGVAILRHYGTTDAVATGPISEQAQLARAAELGLGTNKFEDIELVPIDEESKPVVDIIRAQFNK